PLPPLPYLHSFPTRRSSDLTDLRAEFLAFTQEAATWLDDYAFFRALKDAHGGVAWNQWSKELALRESAALAQARRQLQDKIEARSEEHTSELQSQSNLVCRL